MHHPAFKPTPPPERFEDVFDDYSFLIDPSSFRWVRSFSGSGEETSSRVEYDRSAISREGMFYAGVVLQRRTPLDQFKRATYEITMGTQRSGRGAVEIALAKMFAHLNDIRPCTLRPRYSSDKVLGSVVDLDEQHLMILRMIFKDYLPKLP
jgi:hypothetical protein